ncbi:hypothetical protein CROQUDRAFT_466609 [Cronartium quercuum f. sp. fusiforme G11]|uniref:Uncharacterized protein n=1 Tax=Cronartium quercuum f. sp. fusiforme G11 TaxID=708437 RepID=A0A9P6NUE0_9BASI|nr:hypothetical protein CROQUDRAFT_466609 [Cronartium quercuum f. sp. fusiforme G11]
MVPGDLEIVHWTAPQQVQMFITMLKGHVPTEPPMMVCLIRTLSSKAFVHHMLVLLSRNMCAIEDTRLKVLVAHLGSVETDHGRPSLEERVQAETWWQLVGVGDLGADCSTFSCGVLL